MTPTPAAPPGDDLDALKALWREIGEKLDRTHALDLDRVARERTRRARLWLLPLVGADLVRVAIAVALIALAAPFWTRHLDTPHLGISGVLVHLYAILLAAGACRGIALALALAVDAPVLEQQRRLARLARWRRLTGRVAVYLGCVVWVPLALVVLGAWAGVDLASLAPRVYGWMIASALVALAGAAAIDAWTARRARASGAPADDGYLLGRARAELDAIERFARE